MDDGATPMAPNRDAPMSAPGQEVPRTDRSELRPSPASASVWGGPVLVGLIYLGFWQIAPRVRTESLGAMLLSTILALALIVWFNAQIARGFRRPLQFFVSLVLSAAAILPLRVMYYTGDMVPPWSWLLMVKGLPDLLFVWLASSFGGLLSYLLRSANMIPPIAAVLALVDVWTVFLGPVGKILKSDNPAAVKITQAMTVPLPAPKPSGASAIPPSLVVGFADFLFIAFFVAAISRFSPSVGVYRRMLVALVAVLCGYMLLVFFSGWHLPALLPLAVVMLALHWGHFKYTRSEAFALLYGALFIVLIAAGFWYMAQNPGLAPLPAGKK